MWSYYLMPVIYYVAYQNIPTRYPKISMLSLHLFSFVIAYVPTYIQAMSCCFRGGLKISSVQKHWIWKKLMGYFKGSSIALEEPLNASQLYIFCNFPHGSGSVNHMMTMTNAHNMLTQHFPAERRDLAATVLFLIPFVKDVSPVVLLFVS
jgi:hypothetical protein